MNRISTLTKRLFIVLIVGTCIGGIGNLSAQQSRSAVKGFIANVGQWPSEVLFAHRDGNLDIWITKHGIVFDQFEIKRATDMRDGQVVRLSWTGSTGGSAIGEVQIPSTMNFFIGNDPTAWRTDVPVYSKVRVAEIYRGVDAIYYMDKGNVRYDLDVHAGADITAVGMSVEGSDGLTVDPEKITIATAKGAIIMTDLFAYFLSGKNQQTSASFAPRGSGFSIDVPAYTSDKPLLIDPIVYGTYVGGDAFDKTVGVEYVSGGVLVGGSTEGMTFPAGTGGYQSSLKSGLDAFVALYSKDLQHILRYTYYGGANADRMKALATDFAGSAYFVGESNSADLPISVGAAGQIYRGQIDGFVVKLDSNLKKLEISTYIGGNKDDQPTAVAVDVSGNVFVAGGTNSNANFPTTSGYQKTLGGQVDGFLCRLSPNGSSFVFSTYFGKEGNETFAALALNTSGEPFVTGTTSSANFETAPTPGFFSSGRLPYDRTYNGGNTDGFVVKFFSDGTLSKRDDGTFSTFFGGNGEDGGSGIFVDQGGRAVVVGTTTSTNLPALGTYLTQPIGRRDIFMAVFADDGRALVACTYFGGTGDDDVLGMRPLNATATGVLFGTTASNDFPVFGAGADGNRIGTTDGFITVLNTSSLLHSTLIVGSASDSINAASLDSRGDVYYSVASASIDLRVSD
ncbi:MAG: SBBP repeat-containing protein, partial [Candidatus Kapabacteria bacterium]|nr:SBBP repeat-containing protein [Candidatus Kapabacteria bacterium]